MKRYFYFLLSITFMAVFQPVTLMAGDPDPDHLFERGNHLYARQQYDSARLYYDSLVDMGYQSANLYFNLGNSAYKQNDLPAAILNYERALRLQPNRKDINFNLRMANLRIPDNIEPVPELMIVKWWRNLANMLTSREWAWTGILLLWFALLAAILYIVSSMRIVRKTGFFTAVAGLLIFIFVTIIAWQRHQIEQSDQYAILFAPSAYIKSAPDEGSTDLFILHEGVKMRILDKVGEWKQIRLADGKVGWIKEGTIRHI